MQTRKPFFIFLTLAITIAAATAITPASSMACVGRKLVLASLETDRPGMVSRILSILIHERTGTTVEVRFFTNRTKLIDAVEKGKIDLYVDYVDIAVTRMKLKVPPGDEKERFSAVKRHFEEELNLIWLKPMGYSGIGPDGRSMGGASVVVHKDTLKKFPALPRLLEKIGTRVVLDDGRLDNLVGKSRSEKPAKVARSYLKEVKLI